MVEDEAVAELDHGDDVSQTWTRNQNHVCWLLVVLQLIHEKQQPTDREEEEEDQGKSKRESAV